MSAREWWVAEAREGSEEEARRQQVCQKVVAALYMKVMHRLLTDWYADVPHPRFYIALAGRVWWRAFWYFICMSAGESLCKKWCFDYIISKATMGANLRRPFFNAFVCLRQWRDGRGGSGHE